MTAWVNTNWDAQRVVPGVFKKLWEYIAPRYAGHLRCVFWVTRKDDHWTLQASIRIHGLEKRVKATEHLNDAVILDSSAIIAIAEAMNRLKINLMRSVVDAGELPYIAYVGDGHETDELELTRDARRAMEEDDDDDSDA